MSADSRRFFQIFARACSTVSNEYFHMPRFEADSVYRERVYCYELYHQLRRLWDGFSYTLGGEVDKSGQPFFAGGPYAQSKPDLIVHYPGQMGDNLAVIEAKPATATLEKLKADLNKLSWFCENAHYKIGLLHVFGKQDVAGLSSGELENHRLQLPSSEKIIVFHHVSIGQGPECVLNLESPFLYE